MKKRKHTLLFLSLQQYIAHLCNPNLTVVIISAFFLFATFSTHTYLYVYIYVHIYKYTQLYEYMCTYNADLNGPRISPDGNEEQRKGAMRKHIRVGSSFLSLKRKI